LVGLSQQADVVFMPGNVVHLMAAFLSEREIGRSEHFSVSVYQQNARSRS